MEVMNRLVIGCTKENDIIIDPFMGSGTLPVSAELNKRRYIGIDNNKEFCKLALKRVRFERDRLS
jgi:DNA modification methylase